MKHRPLLLTFASLYLTGCGSFSANAATEKPGEPQAEQIILSFAEGLKSAGKDQNIRRCQLTYGSLTSADRSNVIAQLAAAAKAPLQQAFHMVPQKPSVTMWGHPTADPEGKFLLLEDHETLQYRDGPEAAHLISLLRQKCLDGK